jgi:hypothetical protein
MWERKSVCVRRFIEDLIGWVRAKVDRSDMQGWRAIVGLCISGFGTGTSIGVFSDLTSITRHCFIY